MIDVQIGNSFDLINTLPNKSIDMVMTSPPYYSLRDYKTEPIIFDGLPDCEHNFSFKIRRNNDKSGGHGNIDNGLASKTCSAQDSARFGEPTQLCSKCGAWRGQLGLEPTPELYLKHMLNFFDDVKLKLKDEGNVFVNLGDSYSSSGATNQGTHTAFGKLTDIGIQTKGHRVQNLPAKCLCMIPSRFAWGMIEHDWILRNEIVWFKKNHMPESVTDRLTKAHEVIYHFVKQQKYYYDIDAIREPHKDSSMERYQRPLKMGGAKHAGKRGFEIYSGNDWKPEGYTGKFEGANDVESFGSPRARTQRKGAEYKGKWEDDQEYMGEMQKRINEARANGVPHDSALNHPKGKNPGDIWTIPTAPYPESHFATFPLELVRRPILAGCPKEVCIKCGAPKRQVIHIPKNSNAFNIRVRDVKEGRIKYIDRKASNEEIECYNEDEYQGTNREHIIAVGCDCNAGFKPGIVLDPFAGSGTVGEFCRHNDRNAILFELNPEYKSLIDERTLNHTKPLGDYK